MREDHGEIDLALEGRLRRGVRREDIQGDFHIDAPLADTTRGTVEDVVSVAAEAGMPISRWSMTLEQDEVDCFFLLWSAPPSFGSESICPDVESSSQNWITDAEGEPTGLPQYSAGGCAGHGRIVLLMNELQCCVVMMSPTC